MALGVIIVTYNSGAHLGACLEALEAWRDPLGLEVVVVDNASRDDTRAVAARSEWVRLIANDHNAGFAAAVNQGVRATSADLLLMLNPDACVAQGLDKLVAAFDSPAVAAAGGRLVEPGGSTQQGFQVRRFPTPSALAFEVLGLNRLWPSNPVNRSYRCADLDPGQAADVDQPAGAFLAFRRSCWEQISGLDERFYPVWFEDVDFCLRLRHQRWRIRYVPEAVAIHSGAHSVSAISWTARQLYWYRNLSVYSARHFGLTGRLGVCLAIWIVALPRAVMGVVTERSCKPFAVFGRVILLAAACLTGGFSGPYRAAKDRSRRADVDSIRPHAGS